MHIAGMAQRAGQVFWSFATHSMSMAEGLGAGSSTGSALASTRVERMTVALSVQHAGEKSTHGDGTHEVLLRFINSLQTGAEQQDLAVSLLWVGFDGAEREYNVLGPGCSVPQRAIDLQDARKRSAPQEHVPGLTPAWACGSSPCCCAQRRTARTSGGCGSTATVA